MDHRFHQFTFLPADIHRVVAAGAQAYQAGDPLDPHTNLGPLVTRDAQQRVLGLIQAEQEVG